MESKLTEGLDGFGMPLVEMAFDRSSFQNKVAEKLIGALGEYAFILIAKANHQTKFVRHKETEVEHLLLQMVDLMDLPTKGKFDKVKAAVEMIEFYRDKLSKFATRAKNSYLAYYKSKPSITISEKEIEPLLSRAILAVHQPELD
jgi:hypothetical protein